MKQALAGFGRSSVAPSICHHFGMIATYSGAKRSRSTEKGRPWWLETSALIEVAGLEQDRRFDGDPWIDLLAAWLENRTDASVEEALQICIEKPKAHWTQSDKARIGRCFKALKWERYRPAHEASVNGGIGARESP
jgi:hypothetical protein